MKTVQNISELKPISTNLAQKYSIDDNFRFIDDEDGKQNLYYRRNYHQREEDKDNIPYHARVNSEPFSYGINQDMIGDSRGLSSPSLVRKASVNKSHGDTLAKVQTGVYVSNKPVPNFQKEPSSNYNPQYSSTLDRHRPYSPPSYGKIRTHDPIDDIFTEDALRAQPITRELREEYYKDERKRYDPMKRNYTPDESIRRISPEKFNYETYSELTSPYSDTESLSPYGQLFSRNDTKSPEFYPATSNGLTWLQRQQQKLKERRELRLREERQPHETRLFTELKEIQSRRHMRPTASHRLDGYTSDTTAFADDDDDADDFSVPLHINTMHRIGGTTTTPSTSQYSTLQSTYSSSVRNERPFMAVKRAHEMYSQNSDPVRSLVSHPHGQIVRAQPPHLSQSSKQDSINDVGLLSVVDYQSQQQQSRQQNGYRSPLPTSSALSQKQQATVGISNGSNSKCFTNAKHFRFDALDELIASLSSVTDSSSNKTNCIPAWPQSVRSQSSIIDLETSPSYSTPSPRPQTPAFPVFARSPYLNTTPNSLMQIEQITERLPPKSPLIQRRSTDHQSDFEVDSVDYRHVSTQRSTTTMHNGRTPPPSPVYFGHSRHGSVSSSGNEQSPQEVSAAHVKIVSDTSKFWYKSTISRDEAIRMLRDRLPGTFVVRDSNSFPGAFGLALRVATVPTNLQTKTNGSDELIRHYLIEPTSKGVRIKGCPNEPVFSSLPALIYQHSITQIALPCQLILPEGDLRSETKNNLQADQFQQQVHTQGAACNVLYLRAFDMESLTGPQAIMKAVKQLMSPKSINKDSLVVNFKVNNQGITLTDNKRKLFFRKHYPINTISHCGLDPENNHWLIDAEESGKAKNTKRIFGFVARKPNISNPDNECHLFAELDPHQPATAIVNFVNKILTLNGVKSSN